MSDHATLLRFKENLECNRIDLPGVTDPPLFRSIYLFVPNDHRIEGTCPDPDEDALRSRWTR